MAWLTGVVDGTLGTPNAAILGSRLVSAKDLIVCATVGGAVSRRRR